MTFVPQNPLEESLINAVSDPAGRPQFYRDLVRSEIFVIREGPPPEQTGMITLQESEEISLRMIEWNGNACIPFFTSLLRLQEVLQEEVSYLGLNAMMFMQVTAGSDLVLNPGSEYGKEFFKDEVAAIIDGSIWQPGERREIESETQVLVAHPANYPQELVDALSRLFDKNPDVQRAYVAHVFYPGQAPAQSEAPKVEGATVDGKTVEGKTVEGAEPAEPKGHTLIAVDAAGDWDQLAANVGMVVRQVGCPDPPVDLMRLTGNGGIENYFKESRPFFERSTPAA